MLSYLYNTPSSKREPRIITPAIGLIEAKYLKRRQEVKEWDEEISEHYSLMDSFSSIFNIPNHGALDIPSFYSEYPRDLIGDNLGYIELFNSSVRNSREISEIGKFLDNRQTDKAIVIAMKFATSSEEASDFKVKGFYLALESEHPIYQESFFSSPIEPNSTSDGKIALFLGNTKEEAKRSIQALHNSIPNSGIKVKGFYRFAMPLGEISLDNLVQSAVFLRPVYKKGDWVLERFDPTKPH